MFQCVSKNILVSYLKDLLNQKILPILLFSASTTKLSDQFFRSEDDINYRKNPLTVILKS